MDSSNQKRLVFFMSFQNRVSSFFSSFFWRNPFPLMRSSCFGVLFLVVTGEFYENNNIGLSKGPSTSRLRKVDVYPKETGIGSTWFCFSGVFFF